MTLLVALFLMAVNYNNNLIHALVFLLAAFAVVGAWRTRRHLSGRVLHTDGADPVFAGATASLPVWLEGEAAPGLLAQAADGAPVEFASGRAGLALPCPLRGRREAGQVQLSTRYPLGLFEGRRVFESRSGALVYPAPAGADWPPEQVRPAHRGREAENFAGLRPYAAGDSPRRVAWKVLARGLPPMTKLFDGAEGESALILDWKDAAGDDEARLSQLARWLLNAHAHDLEYTLLLPGQSGRPGRGEAHLRESLGALALFNVEKGAV
jgi:uncharacterized protein (DUF58 family)